MKNYRRILVPIFRNGQSDGLLHTLRETTQGRQCQVLVVRVVESHSGIEADGPAAGLPEEMAARRATEAKRHLELQLARMGLGWAETQVIWQRPTERLQQLVRDWQPDLIIARQGTLPNDLPAGSDVLHTSRRSLVQQLAETFFLPTPKHA